MKDEPVVLSTRVPPELSKAVEDMAEEKERTKAWIFLDALREYVGERYVKKAVRD